MVNILPNLEEIIENISKDAKFRENWVFSSLKKIKLLEISWKRNENIRIIIGLLMLISTFLIIKNSVAVKIKDATRESPCARLLKTAMNMNKGVSL